MTPVYGARPVLVTAFMRSRLHRSPLDIGALEMNLLRLSAVAGHFSLVRESYRGIYRVHSSLACKPYHPMVVIEAGPTAAPRYYLYMKKR